MLLWAEDVDVPLDTARQAVQHVHAQHMAHASLMLDGIPCICSLHEQSLAALLLDLVALKLLGQKQGFLTRLLVAWRGLCLHNACFSLALFS